MRDHFRSLGLAKLYDNRGFGKGKRKQELIHTANGNVNFLLSEKSLAIGHKTKYTPSTNLG